MGDAINSLADAVMKLFSGIGKEGGGGLKGAVGSILGAVFGKGKTGTASDVPGFKTGGSFRVGGRSGIDANLVAFRATRGEMVDIRHGNDAGPAGSPAVVQLVVGEGQMFEPRVAGISGDVSVRATNANNQRTALQARQKL